MSAPAVRVLFDEPGPRGRMRIRVLTVAIVVGVAAVLFWAWHTLSATGELAWPKWKPFVQQWAVWFMLAGLKGTLIVAVVASVVAFPLGALLAVGRSGRNPVLRRLCTAYIEIFRSVPTLLLVYMFLFALPGIGLNLGIFGKLVVPIIMINAAVIAELVRAGINALDRGQREAAYSVGMTGAQTMRLVIMPQAIRLVLPALVTQLVAIVKDSTLGYVVSYPELMKQANLLANNTKLLLQAFVVVSLIYVVINFALTRLAIWLEGRLRRSPGTGRRGDAEAAEEEIQRDLPSVVAPH
ncbi:amino acid ABC transporter permease [Microlunatus ginsengisoli]|uniref:Amino acid ABC transporter permease n=1 Tax=Microlunatus ginsengisoli TaxID=363863 RepID=A0ABP7AGE8_9ACTN